MTCGYLIEGPFKHPPLEGHDDPEPVFKGTDAYVPDVKSFVSNMAYIERPYRRKNGIYIALAHILCLQPYVI